MVEYNLCNISKINSRSFINIKDDKAFRAKRPKYQFNRIEYLNNSDSMDNLMPIENIYEKDFPKNITFNPKYIKSEGNKENILENNIDQDSAYLDENYNSLSKSPYFLYHLREKINKKKKNLNISYSQRKNKPAIYYNTNTFNINKETKFFKENLSITDIKVKNKDIFYKKQMNEFKKRNRALRNKLNIYINNDELKEKQINCCRQKNKNLQNELNNKELKENNINKINSEVIKGIINGSKKAYMNENINNSSFNRMESSIEIDNLTLRQNTLYKLSKSSSKSSIKYNNKSQKFHKIDLSIKKKLQQKNNELKILQQKIQDMKKEIELTTFNNSNLSKLLTKKNIDLIEYQKREIINKAKIEQLAQLLYQKKNRNIFNKNEYLNNVNKDSKMNQSEENCLEITVNRLNHEINFLKNKIQSKNLKIKEIKEENEIKNNQIDSFIKKINEYEISNKEIKAEEKKNLYFIEEYKKDIMEKEGEIKEITKKLNNFQVEKMNLLNCLNKKEKEIKLNKRRIMELEKVLRQKTILLETKDSEVHKYIDDNKKLITELNNKIDIIDKSKGEMNDLLKKIEELGNENNKLLAKINTIDIKYLDQKKLLSESNKKLKEMEEISKSLIEKEKLKFIDNLQKNDINPKKCIIITNKKYKNLIWYLLYKKPIDNANKNEENNYDNYFWVTNLVIKNEDLTNFNKFDDDNNLK